MTSPVTSSLLGLATGTAFGFALEKSKVALPIMIREQMLFRNFTMLKVFMTAVSVGAIVLFFFERAGNKKRKPKAPVRILGSGSANYSYNVLNSKQVHLVNTVATSLAG